MSWMWSMLFCAGAAAVMLRGGGEAALASMMAGAGEAVTLCLELCGAYLLFMGLIGVARRAGLMESLSRKLSGVVGWLFPRAGEAAGAIALTLSANVLGLGNAATPFGLEAMRLLDKQNRGSSEASYEMAAFIAINASALQLLPTGVIAIRQACGSTEPASIVLPSIIATACSTAAAVALCRAYRR